MGQTVGTDCCMYETHGMSHVPLCHPLRDERMGWTLWTDRFREDTWNVSYCTIGSLRYNGMGQTVGTDCCMYETHGMSHVPLCHPLRDERMGWTLWTDRYREDIWNVSYCTI